MYKYIDKRGLRCLGVTSKKENRKHVLCKTELNAEIISKVRTSITNSGKRMSLLKVFISADIFIKELIEC